jgi:SSS family solute:Na+ symporter
VPLISALASISWGGMASAMFVPLFAGLFWQRATRAGALARAGGGFVSAIAGFAMKRAGLIPFHEIYPGLFVSLILMIVVSARTPSRERAEDRELVPENAKHDLL